jgi:hypothetical protein
MANLLNILDYAVADAIRQRSNADRLVHMHLMGAFNAMAPANTLAHGAAVNEIKGTTPFVVRNAARGLFTAAMPGSSLGGVSVYTAVALAPAAPRRRRGRARK